MSLNKSVIKLSFKSKVSSKTCVGKRQVKKIKKSGVKEEEKKGKESREKERRR